MPRSVQVSSRVLERLERLALGAVRPEHDALEPVVADHAAPERVVEVEHQAPAFAAERRSPGR